MPVDDSIYFNSRSFILPLLNSRHSHKRSVEKKLQTIPKILSDDDFFASCLPAFFAILFYFHFPSTLKIRSEKKKKTREKVSIFRSSEKISFRSNFCVVFFSFFSLIDDAIFFTRSDFVVSTRAAHEKIFFGI